jgi:hypothetical protein
MRKHVKPATALATPVANKAILINITIDAHGKIHGLAFRSILTLPWGENKE